MNREEFIEKVNKIPAGRIQLSEPPYTELLCGILSALQDIVCVLQKIAEKEEE